jgi:protein-disulfide isomerase
MEGGDHMSTKGQWLPRSVDLVAAVAVVASTVALADIALTLRAVARDQSRHVRSQADAGRSPATNVSNLTTQVKPTAKGDLRARVALIEYSDFQCPYCGQYARNTFELVDRDFVTAGRIRYDFRSFPLAAHTFAQKAAEATECAGAQGQYWIMHKQLFGNQQHLDAPDLAAYATSLHLTKPTFDSCLVGQMQERVRSDYTEGHRLGVVATPTFFIGRVRPDGNVDLAVKIQEAQPYEVFKKAIEEVLEKPVQTS